MEFKDRLKAYDITVEDIVRAGFSKRTAYAWLAGTRRPRGIQQDVTLDHIKSVRNVFLGRAQ